MALPATNLQANYRSDTNVTSTGGDPDLVTSWADVTGSNALTASGAGRPELLTLTDGDAIEFSEGTFCLTPAGISMSSHAASIFFVMEFTTHWKTAVAADQTLVSLTQAAGKLNFSCVTATETGTPKYIDIGTTMDIGTSLAVVWVVADGTALKFGDGSEQVTGTSTKGERLAGTAGIIGAFNIGAEVNFLNARVRDIAFYDAALSQANIDLVLAHYETEYGVVSTSENRVVVCEGDSLTKGNVTPGDNWTTQFARLFTTQPKLRSVADGGRVLSDMVTNEATRVTAAFAKHSTYTEKYAILWGGSNDISGTTAGTLVAKVASVTADLSTWIAAQASDVTTVVLTTVPRTDFDDPAEESARLQVNAYIAAGSTGADIVVDLAAHPNFQTAEEPYYVDQGDFIHLSVLGAGLVATLVRDQLFPVPTVPEYGGKHTLSGSAFSGRDGFNIALPEDEASPQLVTVKNVSLRGQSVMISVRSTETALVESGHSITLTVPAMSSPILVVRASGTVRRSPRADSSEIPYQVEVSMGGGA